jgi:hypothetical protein
MVYVGGIDVPRTIYFDSDITILNCVLICRRR